MKGIVLCLLEFHLYCQQNAPINFIMQGSHIKKKLTYLVSSCLVGLCTRYDGKVRPNDNCIAFIEGTYWIPVCPEQLGGLPTPRPKAILHDGDGHDVLKGVAQVCTEQGEIISENFIRGAEQVLNLAQRLHVDGVILKSRSPSCAVNGTTGVTAALLQRYNFQLIEF